VLDITIHDMNLFNKFNQYNYLNICYILFKLQKKIYEASKKCQVSLVHGLQKLLLSLSSIKLLAKDLVNNIDQANKAIKVQYKIEEEDYKLNNNAIEQEINKKFIYWLLESEWKAKIEVNSFYYSNLLERIKFLYTIKYDQQILYFKYQKIIFPTHIRKEYLLTKLQSFLWIKQQVLFALKTEYCIHPFHSLNNSIKKNNNNINLLFILLSNILYVGFKWINIRQIKSSFNDYSLCWQILITPVQIIYFSQKIENLYMMKLIMRNFLHNLGLYFFNDHLGNPTNINNYCDFGFMIFKCRYNKPFIYLESKPSIEAIKQLTKSIKNIIYSKNKLGKIKARTNLSLQTIIHHLNIIFKLWQKSFSEMVLKPCLLKIIFVIDEIIYRWMKKKYSSKKIKIVLIEHSYSHNP